MASLPRGYLSYSQIRLYGECPQKYYFNYLAGIPAPVNEKIFLGEIFHATVEDYLTRTINGAPPTAAATVSAFRKEFTRLAKARTIDWHASRRDTKARGAALVNTFLARIAPGLKPLMVEKELSVEIPEIDVTLKGVIDLVETDFSITDFKTSTGKWSASKARNSLQMVIYKYLFERNFGQVHGTLKYEILYAKSAGHVRHQRLEVAPGPEETARMLAVVGHVAANIRAGVFYPQATRACFGCEYFAACRVSNPGLFPDRI